MLGAPLCLVTPTAQRGSESGSSSCHAQGIVVLDNVCIGTLCLGCCSLPGICPRWVITVLLNSHGSHPECTAVPLCL